LDTISGNLLHELCGQAANDGWWWR
jgi:hypothetical protein